MSNHRHNFVPGGTYFFTVSLLDRERDLLVRSVDVLREAVRRVRPFEIADRQHRIRALPPGDADCVRRQGDSQRSNAPRASPSP